MEGLFSLLVFAGLFYFMMRFGCGAHMVHGHSGHGSHGGDREEREESHGAHKGHETPTSHEVDPVCGMEVAPGTGYSRTLGAHTYRFCSRACLDEFEATPGQYAA